MKTFYKETSRLRRNLNEIVRSWIRLLLTVVLCRPSVVVIEGNKEFIWDKLDKSRKVINRQSIILATSVVHPDPHCLTGWILIRVQGDKNDPQEKIKVKKNYFLKSECPSLSTGGFYCSLNVLHEGLRYNISNFLTCTIYKQNYFGHKIQFRIRVHIDLNCWIQIRIDLKCWIQFCIGYNFFSFEELGDCG